MTTAATATATALLLAAALALLVGPGAAICLAAGTRWRDAVAAGPAVSTAVVAVGCAVTAAADIRWDPVSAAAVFLGALLLAGLVGLAFRLLARRSRQRTADPGMGGHRTVNPGVRGPRRWGAELVVVVLSLVPVAQVLVVTRALTAIPQGWDAIFHGGATRYIAETGRAGVTDLAPVSQPANPHFYYPDTYHAFVSLLLHLPGDGSPGAPGGLPGALNAVSAVTGMVFVLGVAVLAGRLTGGSRLAAVGAALVAASCWTFPYLALARGPILPFALGIALIPGLVLLADRLVAPGTAERGEVVWTRVVHALVLGAGMAGAWSVHPSVALAAAIVLGCQAVTGLVAARGLRRKAGVIGGFALAAVPAGLYAGWAIRMVASGTADELAGFSWPRSASVPRAVAGVFDLGPTPVASIGIAVFVLVGLAAAVTRPAWRRPLAAMVASLVAFGTLYVLAAAVHGDWVRVFTGFWWDDAYRFAALLVLPTAVLAGAGVRALVPQRDVRRPSARAGTAVVGVTALLVLSGHAAMPGEMTLWGYRDGPAVNARERPVLDRLAELYRGGAVLNDPFDGTAWAYALHGIPVVFPAPLADDPDAQVGVDRMTLYTSVNRYGFDPSITHEVQRQDVRWILVGTGVVGGPGRPAGFVGLEANPHLRLVDQTDGARLYEVLPVPAGHPPLPVPPPIPPVTPPDQPPNTDSPIVHAVP
ncbi:MAG: hypothetical protein GX636_07435 [Actinomycetales bacterium]|nr:hypothetical protein [Actinomycetales bacterium]